MNLLCNDDRLQTTDVATIAVAHQSTYWTTLETAFFASLCGTVTSTVPTTNFTT